MVAPVKFAFVIFVFVSIALVRFAPLKLIPEILIPERSALVIFAFGATTFAPIIYPDLTT